MNGLGGLISPTGRALQSQMEQMTPEQFNLTAQQYIASGMLSFGDLMTIKAQYDYMKQQGQNGPASPPQTTVAQDMENEIAQGQGGGVATLPAPVGNPQAYAGGGIVAFAGGGGPDPFTAGMTEEELERWRVHGNAQFDPEGGMDPEEREQYRKNNYKNKPKAPKKTPWYKKEYKAKDLWKKRPSLTGIARGFTGLNALGAGIQGISPNRITADELRQYYIDQGYSPDDPLLRDYSQIPEDERPLLGGLADVNLSLLGAGEHSLSWIPGIEDPYEAIRSKRQADAEKAETVEKATANADFDMSSYLNDDAFNSGLAALARNVPQIDVEGRFAGARGMTAQDAAEAKRDMAGGEEAMIAKREKQKRDMGVYAPIEQREQALSKRGERIDKDEKRMGTDALAQFFFTMAANSTKPGATALGAAAEAAPEGFAEYKRLRTEIATNREKLEDAEFSLRQEEAKLRAGSIDAGSEDYRQAKQRFDTMRGRQVELETKVATAQLQADLQTMEKEFQIKLAAVKRTGDRSAAERFADAYFKATTDPTISPEERLRRGKYFLERLDALGPSLLGRKYVTTGSGGLADDINKLREQEAQKNGGGGEGWSITPIE